MSPDAGRFQTMDSYEGTQEEPLTLHKYLYAHADPVNGTDPSGEFFDFNLKGLLFAQALDKYMEVGKGLVLVAARKKAYRAIGRAVFIAAITTLPVTSTGPEQVVFPPKTVPFGPDEDDETDAYVVRGGIATPDQLSKGVAEHMQVPGLTGFSVQSESGKSIGELALAGEFKNKQISVSTVRAIRAVGGTFGHNVDVVKSPGIGYHKTVTTPMPLPSTLAIGLSAAFVQMPNPTPF
jgi:hypothetical protein